MYNLFQVDYTSRLLSVQNFKVKKTVFVLQHLCGADFVAVFKPDLTFRFSHASQTVHFDKSAVNALNTFIEHGKAEQNMGLKFVWTDANSIRLVVFANAIFATKSDMTSQLFL